MFSDDVYGEAKQRAIELFKQAYEAQLANDYEQAVELYQRSIATYPTSEAHTFLGWVYSFEGRYTEAIEQCLRAIEVDPTFGNPYNDIGSYLIAKGDLYGSVRWFKRALLAPRYESYAFPHFNLGRIYESRNRLLEAARHYSLALEQQPGFAQAMKALRGLQARLN
jgi:tetratricopeptide (TPR) repeat protein